MDLGRFQESLDHAQKAIQLDPLDITLHAHLALHYMYARQFDKAAEQAKRTIEMDPSYIQGYAFLADAYFFTKRYKEAAAQFEKAIALSPRPDLKAELAATYARAGEKGKALEILKKLEAETPEEAKNPEDLAIIYESLGDKQKAIDLLEFGYQSKNPNMVIYNYAPWFDSLRNEPRYQELMRKIFRTAGTH